MNFKQLLKEKITLENLEPLPDATITDELITEENDLTDIGEVLSTVVEQEMNTHEEITSDISLVENLNNTLENQLENNQASDASLEMYHVAMEQVFRKYNIPYKNNVVSTEDYSVTTVSLEKQKGFLSGLKEGIWNVIVKVYNAIKEFFKKIFNMIFSKAKRVMEFVEKDIIKNSKIYEAVYEKFASGDKDLQQNKSSTSSKMDGNGIPVDLMKPLNKGNFTEARSVLQWSLHKYSIKEVKHIFEYVKKEYPELFEEYTNRKGVDLDIEDKRIFVSRTQFNMERSSLSSNFSIRRIENLIKIREYLEKNETWDSKNRKMPESDLKFGYVKINPIIVPTRVSDGDFNKINKEFETTFNGIVDSRYYLLEMYDDFLNIEAYEKKWTDAIKKHLELVEQHGENGFSHGSPIVDESTAYLEKLNKERLDSPNGFISKMDVMIKTFIENPIPGVKAEVSNNKRIIVTELYERAKIDTMPICRPVTVKVFLIGVRDILGSMSSLEKKLNRLNLEKSLEDRKEYEDKISELHKKLGDDVTKLRTEIFDRYNNTLLTYLSNLFTIIKYNSKYLNGVIDYCYKVRNVYNNYAPYVK